MNLLFKTLPFLLSLCLFCSSESRAAFVIHAGDAVYSAYDNHPHYKSQRKHLFHSVYPGKKKGVAILLALPGVSMLGLYAFYLSYNRLGLFHILFDILGAALLLLFLSGTINIIGLFGLILGSYLGASLLFGSCLIGLTSLIYILFNLSLDRTEKKLMDYFSN